MRVKTIDIVEPFEVEVTIISILYDTPTETPVFSAFYTSDGPRKVFIPASLATQMREASYQKGEKITVSVVPSDVQHVDKFPYLAIDAEIEEPDEEDDGA